MVTGSTTALAARSLDPLARQWLHDRSRWRLHSVFDRAVNLVSEADGALVAVVGPGASDGPATVVLRDAPAAGFVAAGLVPGTEVFLSGGRILSSARLRVSLADAVLWEPRPARRTLPISTVLARVTVAERIAAALAATNGLAPLLGYGEALAASTESPVGASPTRTDDVEPWAAAAPRTAARSRSVDARPPDPPEACCSVDTPPSDLSPVPRAAWQPLVALVQAWQHDDVGAVEDAARRLSGLGPGLTPSGDDLLAGFASGYQRASRCLPASSTHTGIEYAAPPDRLLDRAPAPRHPAARRTAHRASTACLAALPRVARIVSADLAAVRVAHAVAGRMEETFEAVARALLAGSGANLPAAIERATRIGHSSGFDTLVGLFLGIRLGLVAEAGRPSAGRPPEDT
ncbi:MAG: DUF2877 domain-containing protein [Chloroflexi bacterium]|nr:DUF2877 domain-containing protein [Chloroflexota bacterium]